MPQSLTLSPIESPLGHLSKHLGRTSRSARRTANSSHGLAAHEIGLPPVLSAKDARPTRKTKPDTKILRDQAIVDNLPVVRAIAVKVHLNLPIVMELDDLIQTGILGLIDAVGKYDVEKKVLFLSYAKHRIRGAILDSLRQLDWASRHLRGRHKRVEAITRDLSSQFDRAPTEAEIADRMGVSVERWRQMVVDLRTVGLITASGGSNERENGAVREFPAKQEFHPDCICAKEELREILLGAMKSLPERYQTVVALYYTNDMTMKQIGDTLRINESRVSQIHTMALEKMALALKSAGIHSSGAF